MAGSIQVVIGLEFTDENGQHFIVMDEPAIDDLAELWLIQNMDTGEFSKKRVDDIEAMIESTPYYIPGQADYGEDDSII